MSSVTKRLVFHFYLGKDWRGNLANKCHLNCLRILSYVFDEAIIVIAHDNALEEDILGVKNWFSWAVSTKVLTFKVVRNNAYYEGGTFKSEIIDNAKKLDGITFFAHNKGVSNVLDKNKSKEAIFSWICALYYYNLMSVDVVEKELCSDLRNVFYGTYLMNASYINNKHRLWYAGTFYWVNANRLVKTCDEIPEIFDREYAEWLPGELFDGLFLRSHNNLILPDSDLYRNWLYYAKNSARSEEEYKQFLEFKDTMKSLCDFDEYRYTVLTCNFNGYEIMREIKCPQEDVEYVYVTDDKTLTSSTWSIVYDLDLEGLTPFEKVQKLRENPFKYCSTATCIRIDASIEVTGNLDKLVEDFYMSNCDIGIMVHPERDNVFDEYDKWISWRGIDPSEKDRVLSALTDFGCNLSIKGLYETGFMVYLNNDYTELTLNKVAEAMKAVGNVRVDQVVFSAVVNSFPTGYLFPMSHACIQSKALCSMEHNSCFTCVVKNIPEYGCVRNGTYKLYNLNDYDE